MPFPIHRGAARLAAACVASGAWGLTAHAAVIYGGPTYDAATQTGHQNPSLSARSEATAGDGVGVARTDRREGSVYTGTRAVRWEDTGAITILGHLGADSSGFTHSAAIAINSAGTAVGLAQRYDGDADLGSRAVRWDAGGAAAIELDHLGVNSSGFTGSIAYAINPAGTIVGYAGKFDGGNDRGTRAVRWDAGGVAATELGHIGANSNGTTFSIAIAINPAGTVAGQARKYDGNTSLGDRAVRWQAGGTAATELGHLGTDGDGETDSEAAAINAAGAVVGHATRWEGDLERGDRAVRWDAGSTAATELDHLGTDPAGNTEGYAYSINTAGDAVGYAQKYEAGVDKGPRAVRWDAGGAAVTELGNLGLSAVDSTVSRAYAINDAGYITGFCFEYDLTGAYLGQRAVVWDPAGVALDLNTLLDPDTGWVNLTQAYDISDTGWITGIGSFDPDGPGGQAAYNRLFLLQVPEPASLALLALGGLLLARRR